MRFACFFWFATSVIAAGPAYFPPPESADGWRVLVPLNAEPSPAQKNEVRAKVGLEWDSLQEAWKYCQSFGGPHSLLVIRHGWVAAEWRTYEGARGIASCTKSLTSLAMAKLFDLSDAGRTKKRIRLDDEAWRFLPAEWARADPRRKKIRLRHLLTMTSGLEPYDGPYKDLGAYAKVVLTQPVEAPPGKVWAYASAPVDMMSHIIENVTGRTQRDFFNQEIHAPIGVAPIEWPAFQGHTGGSGGPGGGARYIARELARVGYLLLHGGRWGEHDVVSRKRVEMATRWAPWLEAAKFRKANFARYEPEAQNFYGYLFWTNRTGRALGEAVPRDVFYMSGFGRQACWIFPSLDMVVLRLGSNVTLNEHPEFYRELLKRVMKAVSKPNSK